MPGKSRLIILDTNIWISFLISKTFQGLDQKIKNKSVRLAFSVELFDEFLSVVGRPKFKKYFAREDIY